MALLDSGGTLRGLGECEASVVTVPTWKPKWPLVCWWSLSWAVTALFVAVLPLSQHSTLGVLFLLVVVMVGGASGACEQSSYHRLRF